MIRIKRKRFELVFSSLLALLMSFFMSFFMTVVNIGFSQVLFVAWMKSFVLGFVIALPISIIFIPMLRTYLERFVEE